MAGYSGTQLAKKLGITAGSEIVVFDAPFEYLRLVAPVPDGARVVPKVTETTDIVHVFSTRRRRLSDVLKSCLKQMAPETAIWVSWPKKSSGITSEVTEETIREIALPLGLVDIKVCAVDETWSGLKLVVRKENRKSG